MKSSAKATLTVLLLCVLIYFVQAVDMNELKPYLHLGTQKSTPKADADSLDSMYWYSRLADDEKEAYRTIYSKIGSFPEKIIIKNITKDKMENIYQALMYDNPEFFFLGHSSSFECVGKIVAFIPQYTFTKDVYDEHMLKLDGIVSEIEDAVCNMTDYGKELYIHDYIIKNCEYTDTGDEVRSTAYGALVNGRANCEGYSRAAQLLLKRIGIPCRAVIGDVRTDKGIEGHMWNVVEIGGKPYNLDVTWDDGKVNGVSRESIIPSHMYMNLSAKEISSDHSPNFKEENQDCIYDDAGYFRMSGLLFSDYDEDMKNRLVNEIAGLSADSNCSIEFKFTTKQAYRKAVNGLIENEEIYRLISRANMKSGKMLSEKAIRYMHTDENQVIRIFFKNK